MKVDGWMYYNHAAVPTTAPHETPDISPVINGSIWKNKWSGIPLFARWTTEFDCGYETNWWYIIKQGPFEFETLDRAVRKHIRQSLKKVFVKKIRMNEYAEELCVVHNNACKGYSNFAGNLAAVTHFLNQKSSVDCWAAFSVETNIMVGYMTCEQKDEYVATVTAKYDPQYLNLRASDAIHYTILEYYLNNKGVAYICSGSRTINHVTNAQDYKISTFGFRRAYCRVHVVYNPKFKWIITLIYPIRRLLVKLDRIGIIHQANAVLRMEEIVRCSDE